MKMYQGIKDWKAEIKAAIFKVEMNVQGIKDWRAFMKDAFLRVERKVV